MSFRTQGAKVTFPDWNFPTLGFNQVGENVEFILIGTAFIRIGTIPFLPQAQATFSCPAPVSRAESIKLPCGPKLD